MDRLIKVAALMEAAQELSFLEKKSVFVESNRKGVKYQMSYRGPREMTKATCADCGKECEVPFKPDPSRPVYCRECWAKKRDSAPRRRY